ncbi:exosortase T [uncultured Ruegeria sp.]|uniref:exosortase T n=1 Tax=uncultured Ruegeria sp. TaxID=259304 RepID=UPI00262772FE|nr:exosortase T [uncultured Ruegeria sp.]
MRYLSVDTIAWSALAAASLILAAQPLQWLFQSWVSPAYGSYGYVYVVLILGLGGASLLSGKPVAAVAKAPVLLLLFLAALVRLLGQILAINILSALALAVDVFALVGLLRLNHRPFALSPFWMAALFLFSLPTEMVLQRTMGFPLQMVSADLSCKILKPLFSEVICDGVRITLEQRDILVDLPCSGASGLLLSLAFVVAQNAVMRPRWHVGILSLFAVLVSATIGNSLRISLLAVGLAHDLDVMSEPMHSAIGLLTLGLTVLPFALFYRPYSFNPVRPKPQRPKTPAVPKWIRASACLACLAGSLGIISAKADPVDVSASVTPPILPSQVQGFVAEDVPLTSIEASYFQTYGGQARKVQFGPLGLNVVSTRAPLRHLHAPEICLRGLGYAVRFLGTRYEGVPSAYYQATGPEGDQWSVAVSYVAQSGQVTPSVGEAIWRWMNGSNGTWSSIQRITPWALDAKLRRDLDAAALAALDIQNIKGTDL